MTSEATKNTKTTEDERAEVEARVAEMQTELQTLDARQDNVTWGESETSVAKRISDAARRKLVLPRLIKAGRVKLLELDRKAEEERAAELEQRQQEAFEAMQAATTRKWEADEDLGHACVAYSDANVRLESRRRRIKEINAELAELRGEG